MGCDCFLIIATIEILIWMNIEFHKQFDNGVCFDMLFPTQVLQLNQSAAKAEHGQQQWAGEAAQAQAAAQAYGASASYGSSYGSSYGYAQPAAPAPQPPGSIK